MAAPKCVHAVMMLMMMLLLNWRVCFANRGMSDKKNQQVVNKPEALNGAAGATWSWGNNGGAGAAGIGFNIGGGSGTTTPPPPAPGSGAGSGSGSGSGCGSTSSGSCPGKGSGSCGSGGGGCCPGEGGGSQGSTVGIPSFVIPGLVPIPLWGLYCTPIESCPAGNCGGIRLMFDYSQNAAASTNAKQETKTQQGIRSDDHDQYKHLTDNINGGSLMPKDADEAIDNRHHDQNMDALAPESI